MSLFEITENRVKLCGVTLLKIKTHKKCFLYKFLGIPVWRQFSKIGQLVHKFKTNTDFDMRKFDEEISSLIKVGKISKSKLAQDKVSYLASELYDMGGHSKCIRDLSKSLVGIYKQKLFLTRNSGTYKYARNLVSNISSYMDIESTDFSYFNFEKQVKAFAEKIIDYAPKAIMIYIHPDDAFGTAVLSYLKRTTKIKLMFFNHASHFPNLGMTFADIILEGMPTTVKVTHEKRHLYNTKIIGLQSQAKEETVYYSKKELDKLKKQMGAENDCQITMSGGSAYKFFDKDESSEYFEMILRLLQKEHNLYHVVISELNKTQEEIIDRIFSRNPKSKKRLIFIPYQTNFDKYFQCADVFIDSFPVSSALTQIDLMRNKVASVVKINKKTPEYSFHEYQMADYPYMFENVADMENAIIELLHDNKKRQEIIAKNYEFWLNTYESRLFCDRVKSVIEEKNV